MTTNEAIRVLIVNEPNLCIVLDDAPGIYICPVILDADCTADPDKIGSLEYQVSNGIPGQRSWSLDVYTWEEAKQIAREGMEE